MTMNTRNHRALLAGAVALASLLAAGPAGAAPITTSNLAESMDQTNWAAWQATSFTTDADFYLLDNVKLKLSLFEDGGTNQVFIYDDENGHPGSLLPNGELSGSFVGWPNVSTYTPTGDVSLAPNTTYWVINLSTLWSGGPEPHIFWHLTASSAQSGPWGIGTYAFGPDGDTWTDIPGYAGMFSVSATPVSDVPEPATLTLAGLAMLGALLRPRRRR